MPARGAGSRALSSSSSHALACSVLWHLHVLTARPGCGASRCLPGEAAAEGERWLRSHHSCGCETPKSQTPPTAAVTTGLLLACKHGRTLLPCNTQRMSCLVCRDVAEGCHWDIAAAQVPGGGSECRAKGQSAGACRGDKTQPPIFVLKPAQDFFWPQ